MIQGKTMAKKTVRINIHGLCRAYDLWTGEVEDDALEGVRRSTWTPQGSDRPEKSFLIDEGEQERNIPALTFNILQAAEANPIRTKEIIHKEAPDIEDKFELDELELGEREWYVELVDALVYLSVDRYDDYGERYWYRPWQKAKERNPELLGRGRRVSHPGLDDDDEQEVEEEDVKGESAAEADW
jgi:hypothetical protein